MDGTDGWMGGMDGWTDGTHFGGGYHILRRHIALCGMDRTDTSSLLVSLPLFCCCVGYGEGGVGRRGKDGAVERGKAGKKKER